jgi:hypothetical protein
MSPTLSIRNLRMQNEVVTWDPLNIAENQTRLFF